MDHNKQTTNIRDIALEEQMQAVQDAGHLADLKKSGNKAKRTQRNRRLLLAVLLVVVLVCFALFAPFFRVTSIECSGNQRVTKEQIVSASQISMGYNLYRTAIGKASRNITHISYIKSAQVARKFPNKIIIRVTESPVAAYLPYNEGFAYLDKDGKVLDMQPTPPQSGGLIEALGVLKCEGGKVLQADNADAFRQAVVLMQLADAYGLVGSVTNINTTNLQDVTVTLDGTLVVQLGNSDNMEYKFGFLTRQAYESLGAGTKGFLDVRTGNKGFFSEKKREIPQPKPTETPRPSGDVAGEDQDATAEDDQQDE